ncbi:MAG TPA: nucleotidyltransferase family protein [Candidatus Xenobia bacterium]|jgi:hypothetical protein
MDDRAKGRLVASLLAGTWRAEVPSWPGDPWQAALPILSQTSTVSLAWRKLQDDRLLPLHKLEYVRNVVVERDLAQAVTRLRSAGIEPLLVKGWSSARTYHGTRCRHLGDVDLCIEPGQFEAAQRVVLHDLATPVDLHRGMVNDQGYPLDALDWRELHRAGVTVALGETPVRVLAAEDHLRVVGLHSVRSGFTRVYQLCDVASALEAVGSDFDWGRCLRPLGVRLDWLECAAGLAVDLLGARLPAGPLRARSPDWVRTAVERRWGRLWRPFQWRDPGMLYDRLSDPLWSIKRWSGALQTMPRWRCQAEELRNSVARVLRMEENSP